MRLQDVLFPVNNAFYLGAYQNAINEGADLLGLSDKDALERDCFVYRSYIALGSYQVRLGEANLFGPLQARRDLRSSNEARAC